MAAPLRLVPEAPYNCSPLLRWAGGKSWFVKEHGENLFETAVLAGQYIEPFLGGAAMALYLGLPNMVLGDKEADLIYTYYAIRDETEELATYLNMLEDQGTDEESYYSIRGRKANSALAIAAKTIYLNRLSFNGLYRKNLKGEFNVPYGKKKKPMPTLDELREVARALGNAQLICRDFEVTIEKAQQGDFIYCDPPYDTTQEKAEKTQAFTNYTPGGFTSGDQFRLSKALQEAAQRGAIFVAHNSDTAYVRKLYEWANIYEMPEPRRVSANGDRGAAPCLLITNLEG